MKYGRLTEYLGIIISGIVASLSIVILRFTDWRPFGYCGKADSINYTVETISFSVLAAIIFWIVNDYTIYRSRKAVAVSHINRQICTIEKLIKQMIDSVEPFSFEPRKYSLQSFKDTFNQKNLYDGFYGGDHKIVDVYTDYKVKIELIAENLAASYSKYMSLNQLEYLDALMSSFLIRNTITPIDFSMPVEHREFFPSNQDKIGESIFIISKMKWPV